MKKKVYLISFLMISIFVIIMINYKRNQFSLHGESVEFAFRRFISENTGKKLLTPCDYNMFLLTSPLDCRSCSKHFISKDFINSLKTIGLNKGLSICINYILTGDYSEKEKLEYISEIQDDIKIYIDKNNVAKAFLLKKFDTIRTPFLIILTRKGEIKYYQDFKPDERYGYRYIYSKSCR